MNRKRRVKGEQILRNAEANLLEHLLEVLPEVANGGQPLFRDPKFNPQALSPAQPLKEAEALVELSQACLEMREALELPVAGSVGKLFLEACEEAASSDEHRRGPRSLAETLLASLSKTT